MFNPSTMTPQQRMWGAALCQMLLDALDGPMPIPNDAEEELQSRYMSYYQVDQMDDMFCFAILPLRS